MGMERQISVMLKNSPGQMATVDDALAETAAKLAAAGINRRYLWLRRGAQVDTGGAGFQPQGGAESAWLKGTFKGEA